MEIKLTATDILETITDADAFKTGCYYLKETRSGKGLHTVKDKRWCYDGYVDGEICPRCNGTGKVYDVHALRMLRQLKELLDNLPEVIEE